MKPLILSGVVFALLAGTALAQTAPPPLHSEAEIDDASPSAPPPGPPGHRPPPPGEHRDAGAPGGHRAPPRAAHFRLERGDAALDVKCADDEPMKACADIVLQLLDKMQEASKP